MKQWIVFTDLDGTLLDSRTYSFEFALPALRLLNDMDIPLVFSSSKTRTEIEFYREMLGNKHPFISENGGGVFIPKGYFDFSPELSDMTVQTEKHHDVIILGAVYKDLRRALTELRQEGFPVRGFGDMTVEEVAELTGLTLNEAAMAKERDFDEPFIVEGDAADIHTVADRIVSKGFQYTQGQFFHILGNSDKGKAVSILINFFKRKFGGIATITLGDSPNDIPMLEQADYPVIVQKPEGGYDRRIQLPNLIRANGAGPAGWSNAVLSLIQQESP